MGTFQYIIRVDIDAWTSDSYIFVDYVKVTVWNASRREQNI